MKNTAAIDYLDKEAQRFTQLAKDAALKHLSHCDQPGPENENAAIAASMKARDHLIRAETYKDAARIVLSHSGRSK